MTRPHEPAEHASDTTGAPTAPPADRFPALTERRVLLHGAIVVTGAGALAACGSSAPAEPVPSSSSAASTSSAASPSAAPSSAAATTDESSAPAAAGGTPTSEVPVGGGTIFADKKVVVTQPEAGTFKAFDTTCPHQGCAVAQVTGTRIVCPCHGSAFDTTTGDVVNGPATRGLSARTVTVAGENFTVS